MFLGKYQLKKKIGEGAYGKVFMVEDSEKNQYAIKVISRSYFTGQNDYLFKYIENQIQTLKRVKSANVMELYTTQQDKNNLYMICQYCNGGDLLINQMTQPNRVYSLQKAIQILSQVIKGLHFLHKEGYIHRDIKAQNILLKKYNEKQIYKISDFGFSRNIDQINGTLLGTQYYMAPQIYTQQEQYGFQVDVWAFSVMFYYMLNQQFPFQITSSQSNNNKIGEEIKKQALNFSYQKSVNKTKKKLLQNCTKQVQDFFKKAFDVRQRQRINFNEIRKHSLFQKYFIEKQEKISQIYDGSIMIKNPSCIRLSQQINQTKINSVLKLINEKQYEENLFFIQDFIKRICFLNKILEEFKLQDQIIKYPILLSLQYNIIKYMIILYRNLAKQSWLRLNSDLKQWGDFCRSNKFFFYSEKIQNKINSLLKQLEILQLKCKQKDNLEKINEFNSDIQNALLQKVGNLNQLTKFTQKSYRNTTKTIYQIYTKKLKQLNINDTNVQLNINILLITIVHCFNYAFVNTKLHKIVFSDYFMVTNKSQSQRLNNYRQFIDFQILNKYLLTLSQQKINSLTYNLLYNSKLIQQN